MFLQSNHKCTDVDRNILELIPRLLIIILAIHYYGNQYPGAWKWTPLIEELFSMNCFQ